jgi:uncharacterized glyoxalase superfamily protein PhnB
MPLNSISPILPANDVLETVRWYEVKLGFQRRFLYSEPPYAVITRDGIEIHFAQFKVDPKNNHTTCYVRVSGVDKLYESWRAQGLIHPNAPLEKKPWGQKEFAIADPNGNLLRFGEAVA